MHLLCKEIYFNDRSRGLRVKHFKKNLSFLHLLRKWKLFYSVLAHIGIKYFVLALQRILFQSHRKFKTKKREEVALLPRAFFKKI